MNAVPVVTVAVARVTGARLEMAQTIRLAAAGDAAAAAGGGGDGGDGPLVATATATVVFLDSRYRPARIPPDVRRVFEGIAAAQAAAQAASGGSVQDRKSVV